VLSAVSWGRLAIADTASIPGVADGNMFDGNGDGFDPADRRDYLDTSIAAIYGGSGGGVNVRGAVEFDLSSLPHNSTITSVVLMCSLDASTGSQNTIGFGAYAGDGIIKFTDALASNTPIGTLSVTDDWWQENPNRTVPLDAAAIQGIFNTSRYLGLNVWRISGDGSVGLASLENVNPYWLPSLTVTYAPAAVPEASALALLGIGGVALLRRRRRARRECARFCEALQ